MKQIGDLTVNDGKGMYDNEGMCKLLLKDLNELPKLLIDNQFIEFGRKIGEMGHKILNLHKGIHSDMESKNQQIEELKMINDELLKQLNEKDGGDNGAD